MTLAAVCPILGIKEDDRQNRVERFLEKSVKEGFLEETVGTFSLKDRYRNTWPRIRKLVETLGHRMFEEQPKQNPLRVMKKGNLHWLTTQDLALLTLFTLNPLLEHSWQNPIPLLAL